jgi:hypothetical protein
LQYAATGNDAATTASGRENFALVCTAAAAVRTFYDRSAVLSTSNATTTQNVALSGRKCMKKSLTLKPCVVSWKKRVPETMKSKKIVLVVGCVSIAIDIFNTLFFIVQQSAQKR